MKNDDFTCSLWRVSVIFIDIFRIHYIQDTGSELTVLNSQDPTKQNINVNPNKTMG